MSYLELGPIIFGGNPGILQYLRQHRLLSSSEDCDKCSTAQNTVNMVERPRASLSDGVTWRCPQCHAMKSIRTGSFFSKSRLSLMKWLLMIMFWAKEYPVTQAAEDAEIGEDTAINIYQWLREVCSTALIQMPCVLGGPQKVVQIDESLFKHKPKVIQ